MYQINQAAVQGGSIEVDTETASLLEYADACYQQSDGLFDISSGSCNFSLITGNYELNVINYIQ